ncbi:hypothetical protein [Streptomyces sp. NPDC001492]
MHRYFLVLLDVAIVNVAPPRIGFVRGFDAVALGAAGLYAAAAALALIVLPGALLPGGER